MTPSDEHWFDHEKLEVYREAIAFVAWLSTVLENTVRVGEGPVGPRLHVRAADIAEGKGKYAPKDRCRFFDRRSTALIVATYC